MSGSFKKYLIAGLFAGLAALGYTGTVLINTETGEVAEYVQPEPVAVPGPVTYSTQSFAECFEAKLFDECTKPRIAICVEQTGNKVFECRNQLQTTEGEIQFCADMHAKGIAEQDLKTEKKLSADYITMGCPTVQRNAS